MMREEMKIVQKVGSKSEILRFALVGKRSPCKKILFWTGRDKCFCDAKTLVGAKTLKIIRSHAGQGHRETTTRRIAS